MMVQEGSLYDLHLFNDVFKKAYWMVAYPTNYIDDHIVLTSKARVAPLKSMTPPPLIRSDSHM